MMPNFIGRKHNNLIGAYIETSSSSISLRKRLVPAINRKGFVYPVPLSIKVLDDLS